MPEKISRRAMLKNAGVAGAGLLLPGPALGAAGPRILPFTSTSDVYIPPRGKSFMKFSFDFPEPSVEFGGLQFSFRFYTFENTYGLDRDHMKAEEKGDWLDINCTQFVWAGGQEKSPGKLTARIRKNGSFIEWDARVTAEKPIKSIAAIVRGVPRGEISSGGARFFDPKDDEILLGYPFGGGDLFRARGTNTPLAVIRSGGQDYFFLSFLDHQVRANRFYFQPGAKGYRTELVHERPGWEKESRIQSPVWRVGRASTAEGAFRPHFEHLERSFSLPDWETRADIPAWFRRVALAVSLHGMHWTGYIFNDYAKMLTILRWVATKIPGERVLVFLPAWDGRYYWNYPLYQPDSRMGGEAGLRTLIQQGRSLGFHFMPMFGMNSANDRLPVFSRFSDATTAQIDGDPFYANWVDWDNDRHMEGWLGYMNLGV
ncbi:MAG TPA: twin-arginine translocation signal domain-containing protein, partial [Terriglobia bacterium]|nr:twin-arginine translocation signal domain-containing protein [Terriglobia bacterium]